MSQPLDLDDRYGRKPPRSRYLAYLLFVALFGWILWSALHHSKPEITATLVSFKTVSEKSISITFEVIRRDPDNPLDCRLTAVDIDKFIVGEITYRVVPGEKRNVITTEIPTRSRSVSASVVRCTAAN